MTDSFEPETAVPNIYSASPYGNVLSTPYFSQASPYVTTARPYVAPDLRYESQSQLAYPANASFYSPGIQAAGIQAAGMSAYPLAGARSAAYPTASAVAGNFYQVTNGTAVPSGQPQMLQFAPTSGGASNQNVFAAGIPTNGNGHLREPLKIVHVGPCMLRGGSEQWLIALTRYTNPQRLQFTRCIVGLPHLVDPQVVADLRIPVEYGQHESVQRAARECDVMVFWGLPIQEWLGDVRPKLCVYVAHGEADWTRQTLEQSVGIVDHVVAVSQRVSTNVCNGTPNTVIANGVDTAHLTKTRDRDEMRQSLGFAPGDFVLGFIGRFSNEKRPEVLIDAVERLPRNFKALFVGWGDMQPALSSEANRRIPGRYAFASAGAHLGNYYQAIDTLCLVSDHEGFGMVVLEAMMCERPVIARSVGAVPDIIEDRVNGLVVSGDGSSVAQAAHLLYSRPRWASGLAAEGRAFAERHGHASRMALEYENLFERLWSEKFEHAQILN